MIFKKVFNMITPYKRTLLTFKINEKKAITLPAVNTAVFFLSNGDKIYIDSLERFNEYVFLDYQLIDDQSDKKFQEEMTSFKQFIKEWLLENKPVEFLVEKKIIYNGNFCVIELQLANYE